jgi:hypothetical protein
VAQVLRSKKGITAVGNAQVDTAQSYFGGASLLLDGTGDRLTVSSDSSFAFSGDFTIEFWIRWTARTGSINYTLFDGRLSTDGSVVKPTLYHIDNGLRYFVNGGDRIVTSTLTITNGVWYHYAISRSGSSTRLFIDGTQSGSTYTDNNSYVATAFSIGDYAGGGFGLNGHIDEIRVSNIARYTTTFTPSTTPFTNDANTLLLIHANGTNASTFFEDDNGVRGPKGIIAIGNAQVDTAQSQFGGASALFDGTSDYLTIPNAGLNFAGDFTIEFWARHAAINDQQVYFDFRAGNTDHIVLYLSSSNKLEYYDNSSYTGTTNIAANTWYHIALSRSGSALRLFINGTQEWNNTNSRSHTNSGTVFIGTSFDLSSTNSMNGHIDEFRVSNSARYTTGFTPSTTPFVNDANTLLLIHADGTDASTVFRDDVGEGRSARGIQAIGNAQVDTAQSKFGGASALFDGTGDSLLVNNPTAGEFEFTAGEDFTLEAWVRPAATPSFAGIISLGSARSGNEYTVYTESGALRAATFGGSNLSTTASTLSTNTWYHVAVSRSGTTVRLFLDGTQVDSDTYTFTAGQQSTIRIGSFSDGSLSWNGHIDEVRISNIARYTAAFTPSTTPFQNDANTLLLIHADGTDASTVFIDDNGIAPYTP